MSNLGAVPGALRYTQFSKYRWVYGFWVLWLFPLGALVYRVAIAERLGAGQRILAVGGLLGAALLLPVAISRVIDLVRAARTSELATDRLRLAMESGKAVGWDWDVKSGRDSWFGDLETMFGIPAKNYEGCVEDFRRRIHPHDRGRVWSAVSTAMKERALYSAEFRVVRADGTVRWVAAKGKFYYLPNGEPKRMLGMAFDITELKRAQEALGESEERLRMAAEAGKMFAYCWDATTDKIERSGESSKILGITETTLLTGQQAVARIHDQDREGVKAAIAALRPEQPCLKVVYRIVRPDASMIWVERNSRAYFDEQGRLLRIVGMVADITERKQAEEAVASVSRKLIEAQESERGRIARDLHDDIGQRLSLSAILLEELHQRLPADAQEKLSGVQKQISEITTDVHTLSHELHSSTLEQLGLAAAMRACCKELSGQTKADIQFRAEGVPKALPPEIALCLFRVLQESLHNAIKHSGVREVGVELRGSSEELDLIVRDGGVGFDPKTASHGKGLGLVSMQERLKLVQGQLSIDSRCNLGTTIHARVPVPANGGATRGDWGETRGVWRLSEDSGET